MNTQQRAAMQMALEDLRAVWPDSRPSIVALREALAQPQGEWVDLTDDEKYDLNEEYHNSDGKPIKRGYDDAIIAKFKSKNTPPVVLRLLIEAMHALDQEPNYNVSLRKDIRSVVTKFQETNTPPVVQQASWKHTCNALCVDDLELWVDQCPHCGKPRSTTPPVQREQQEPVVREHELIDVRCGCCGYMTYHREHMGCIKAAHVRTKDLTDDEIERALDAAKVPELPDGYKSVDLEIARAVIAAYKEKNK